MPRSKTNRNYHKVEWETPRTLWIQLSCNQTHYKHQVSNHYIWIQIMLHHWHSSLLMLIQPQFSSQLIIHTGVPILFQSWWRKEKTGEVKRPCRKVTRWSLIKTSTLNLRKEVPKFRYRCRKWAITNRLKMISWAIVHVWFKTKMLWCRLKTWTSWLGKSKALICKRFTINLLSLLKLTLKIKEWRLFKILDFLQKHFSAL